ncbi:unnamed protein product [Cuscuta campestris]|uniref:RING-type domain-containing protein n=1 Tax=Cuscuta campestris TaxID=132261 RepID=A0A484MJ63_9ASTE|nr:unnamed protein product [Cuscuta campestris]
MKEIAPETPPPSGNTTADDGSSSYVTAEGIHLNLPRAAGDCSPAPHCGRFPVRITVRFRLSRAGGGDSSDWSVDLMDVTYSLRGVEIVNWLVDHMNLPFSLSGVKLLWKGFSTANKDEYLVPVLNCVSGPSKEGCNKLSVADGKTVSKTSDGCEMPVADWDSMTVLIHEFLQNVTAGENRGSTISDLRITKYAILGEDERKAIIKRRNRDEVGGNWKELVFGLPQRVMELRMKAVVEKAIERVAMEDCGGGGGGEAVTCGVCLGDLWDGSVVAGLSGCLHRFHERCIVEWLVRNMSCPYCRSPIPISAAVQNNG